MDSDQIAIQQALKNHVPHQYTTPYQGTSKRSPALPSMSIPTQIHRDIPNNTTQFTSTQGGVLVGSSLRYPSNIRGISPRTPRYNIGVGSHTSVTSGLVTDIQYNRHSENAGTELEQQYEEERARRDAQSVLQMLKEQTEEIRLLKEERIETQKKLNSLQSENERLTRELDWYTKRQQCQISDEDRQGTRKLYGFTATQSLPPSNLPGIHHTDSLISIPVSTYRSLVATDQERRYGNGSCSRVSSSRASQGVIEEINNEEALIQKALQVDVTPSTICEGTKKQRYCAKDLLEAIQQA
eukprot:Tbor_TRINITY_DN4604_c0_g1::TRINITY_DN4604_c0_g1_i1::g.14988::m.14988